MRAAANGKQPTLTSFPGSTGQNPPLLNLPEGGLPGRTGREGRRGGHPPGAAHGGWRDAQGSPGRPPPAHCHVAPQSLTSDTVSTPAAGGSARGTATAATPLPAPRARRPPMTSRCPAVPRGIAGRAPGSASSRMRVPVRAHARAKTSWESHRPSSRPRGLRPGLGPDSPGVPGPPAHG